MAARRGAIAACLGVFVLAALAAAVGFALQPPVEGEVGPGSVSIDPALRRGDTVVDLPPLGQVRADTHDGPMAFNVRLNRIDLEQAGTFATDVDPAGNLRAAVEDDLRPLLARLARQSLLGALAVGVGVSLVLPRRRVRYVVASVAGSMTFVVGAGAMAGTSFQPDSFDQPQFEGSLAAAPDIINTVQRHIDDVTVVESRLEALSDRLVDLYRSADGDSEPTGTDVTILHVSDVHSNPVGIELIEETAQRFDVDAIIDTGDLTSFGAGIETAIVDRVARIPSPYYVVPGNHDHPSIRKALRDAGVEVLDPGVVEIEGIRVLGAGDPTFTANNDVPAALFDASLEHAARELRRQIQLERPAVVAVHNRRQMAESLGLFEVGLAGHVHVAGVRYADGSVIVEAGSSGATGVGAFLTDEDFPYAMQLLQFEDGRLVAIDRLEFRGTEGEFFLERVLIDPNRVDAYPDRNRTAREQGPLGPIFRPPDS